MDSSVIIRIIAEQLGIEEKAINEQTAFADLGADSLDLFQIISALEEEFDVEFDGDDAEEIKTVGEAIEYIKNIVEQ